MGVGRAEWSAAIVGLIRQPKVGALAPSPAIHVPEDHQANNQRDDEHYHGKGNMPVLKT